MFRPSDLHQTLCLLTIPSCCLQTLVKLNPKLESMLELIQANRARWEELHRLRQLSQDGAKPPDCCVDETTIPPPTTTIPPPTTTTATIATPTPVTPATGCSCTVGQEMDGGEAVPRCGDSPPSSKPAS